MAFFLWIAFLIYVLIDWSYKREQKKEKKLAELRRNHSPIYKVKQRQIGAASTTVFEHADLSEAVQYASENFNLQQILTGEVMVCESLGGHDLKPIQPESFVRILKENKT